ncbi:ankyrin repeat domain-containing protein [Orientia tsutsugamushi]|uniref:ankyrin repeat domain-containing protein n=1 Tax=Orientia tsutsugamushi TaxID=784 RepID=UPI003529A95B
MNNLQLYVRLLYLTARNIFSPINRHPLSHAAEKGYMDVVEYLINHGIDVNTQNHFGSTALHIAAYKCKSLIVTFLLASNANPNLQNNSLNTALHYSVVKGDISITNLLLNHNANPNLQNNSLNTALHYSVVKGDIFITNLLLNHNANPNLQNDALNTALHYSVENSNISITNLLLNHNADITIQGKFSHTPFRRAWIKYIENPERHLEMMRLLITHMVKIERANLVDTSSPGFLENKELVSESEELKGLEQQCHKEIEEMRSICVSKNNSSFFDIFVLQKDMNILARCANNPDIVKCQNRFPMYSSCIEKSIEEGKERAKLLQGAVESVDEIFESNQDVSQKSHTSWLHLPPEVRLMILENLGDDDLTKLQHNEEAAAEAEAQVGGAYAIYEGE